MHTLGLKECKNCLGGKDLCQFRKIVLILGFRYKLKRFFKGLSLEKSSIEKGIAMIFSGGCGTYFGKPGITGFQHGSYK